MDMVFPRWADLWLSSCQWPSCAQAYSTVGILQTGAALLLCLNGQAPWGLWLSWSQGGVVPLVWALRSWHHEILKLQELALLCFGLVDVLEQPETRMAQEGTRLLPALHIPRERRQPRPTTALTRRKETELKGVKHSGKPLLFFE